MQRTPRPRSTFASMLALSAACVLALAPAARATWSIVIVDTSTHEVAIGCATCLESFDLEVWVPVMLTGVGGACCQSSIDSDGKNRGTIWSELQKGTAPADILTIISHKDHNFQSRQMGIVDMLDRFATFTGTQCGPWAGGVGNTVGTITYAIQGNVLAGAPVVDLAEQAVLNTQGDLAEKLMAGMEAAASMGGDGRCSCDPVHPDSCGSPPPGTWKSAHCGFMMISRIGDTDGTCSAGGCANGTYYLNFNIANQHKSDPDPVVQLRTAFDAWRNSELGRPDHIKSQKSLGLGRLPGNGTATTNLDVKLMDWTDTPVGHGGATVTATHSSASAGLSKIGTAVDHGDGTYTIPITAGVGQGTDEFVIVADDGLGPVTLYPFPQLVNDATLTADAASISAAAGATVNFALAGPASSTSLDYLLLASASGTSPGFPLSNLVVPLNVDTVLILSYLLRDSSIFVNTDAPLAPDGSSTAQFVVGPNALGPLVGGELDFAFFTHGPATFVSNPVAVSILP